MAGKSEGSKKASFEALIAELEAEDRTAGRSPEYSVAAYQAGALVRAMRRSAGLTQAQLAAAIGVTQARVSEVETGLGPQGPGWDLFSRIASACGAELIVRMPTETTRFRGRRGGRDKGEVVAMSG